MPAALETNSLAAEAERAFEAVVRNSENVQTFGTWEFEPQRRRWARKPTSSYKSSDIYASGSPRQRSKVKISTELE